MLHAHEFCIVADLFYFSFISLSSQILDSFVANASDLSKQWTDQLIQAKNAG
eukprot:SAG31_NODE_29718_length_391_cov_0.530822_1_plen_51_part_10